jgi:hypothetical protein
MGTAAKLEQASAAKNKLQHVRVNRISCFLGFRCVFNVRPQW